MRRFPEKTFSRARRSTSARLRSAIRGEGDFKHRHFDFLLEGIPALIAMQETEDYVPVYHSSADTLDKVGVRTLKDHAGIAAVTVYNIADRPKRLGRRISREDVQFLLEDTGLDDQMKFLEVWEDWEQGRRGRAK